MQIIRRKIQIYNVAVYYRTHGKRLNIRTLKDNAVINQVLQTLFIHAKSIKIQLICLFVVEDQKLIISVDIWPTQPSFVTRYGDCAGVSSELIRFVLDLEEDISDWIHTGNVGKLEELVLNGYADLLLGRTHQVIKFAFKNSLAHLFRWMTQMQLDFLKFCRNIKPKSRPSTKQLNRETYVL